MHNLLETPIPGPKVGVLHCFAAARAAAMPAAAEAERHRFAALLALRPESDIGAALTIGLCDGALLALASLMPLLLCGEESAVIAFAGFHRNPGMAARAGQLWAGIAHDECFHEYMLTQLVRALAADHLPDAARKKRAARLFFMRLKSGDPVVHFARIAALDSSISRILAAMQHRHSLLHGQGALMRVLGKIRHDESRHVSVTRHYLLDSDVPMARLRHERAWVSDNFRTLLLPYFPAFDRLHVDPAILMKCLH